MNKNYTPSPWGPEPVTALMAIPKMAEFRSKVREAILDESKGTIDYINLEETARELGMRDVSHTLHEISQDEHRHFMTLNEILEKIEGR
jgi:rubrerythrin